MYLNITTLSLFASQGYSLGKGQSELVPLACEDRLSPAQVIRTKLNGKATNILMSSVPMQFSNLGLELEVFCGHTNC